MIDESLLDYSDDPSEAGEPFGGGENGATVIQDIEHFLNASPGSIVYMLQYSAIPDEEIPLVETCIQLWQSFWRRPAFVEKRREFLDLHASGQHDDASMLLPPWAFYAYTRIMGSLGANANRTRMGVAMFSQDARALNPGFNSPPRQKRRMPFMNRRERIEEEDEEA